LEQIGLVSDDTQLVAMLQHLESVRKWANTYNLVARGDLEALVTRHLLDALAIHQWVPSGRMLDVGSGAGFPGIPLAIVRRDVKVCLVDSMGKRVRFLRHVARQLSLENIEVAQSRVEEFDVREPFNTIVCRAFASLSDFMALTRHVAGPFSRFLAIKGRFPEAELANLPDWVRIDSVEKYDVPDLHATRHLVIMSISSQAGRMGD
jgi:16S rRNA (guanine527-N7)-methyltransferase